MGTTLQNGVYLPNEGERNCYAGLKTNWEILDQKVADVTALQQAVAGALHREIVESLPTTDINPNTIYMILSGTSATENVYDEYMYVNNAWELIGTSATDLTNYYTKGDVDGLLLLKANASDLTSHTGDTTIHVTANDKTKWTNSANTHVLRLALSALTPSTSDNSFSNLDDSTALKVGDKVMDTAGVLFEVTAIDTQNSTFTIGTALIDLAQDSDVVHKSGDETVSGIKTFIDCFLGKNLSGQTVDLNDCVDAYGGAIHYYYAVSNYTNISNKPENKPFILESKTVRYVSSVDYIYYQKIYTADYNAPPSIYTRYYRSGSASWSNWVKDTDKFVTTDTNQTISGNKTFNGNTNCVGEFNQTAPFKMTSDTSFATGSKNTTIYDQDGFQCSNEQIIYNNSKNIRRSWIVNNNGSGTTVSAGFNLILSATGGKVFYPISDSDTDNGTSSAYWKNTYTKRLNGVEPSSLSLPDFSNGIDISSYITDLTGASGVNKFIPSVNGWVSIGLSNADFIEIYIPSFLMGGTFTKATTSNYSQAFMPVIANKEVRFALKGSSIGWAKFYPCQGNV